MKPKVLKKRLVLNKKTIADLSEKAMGKAYGGYNTVPYCTNTCPTYCISIGDVCDHASGCLNVCTDPVIPLER
jgi:hypothetical protein